MIWEGVQGSEALLWIGYDPRSEDNSVTEYLTKDLLNLTDEQKTTMRLKL